MMCQECGKSGFKKDELNDYYGDGIMICGECADMHDIQDKYEGEYEEDEDEDEDENE